MEFNKEIRIKGIDYLIEPSKFNNKKYTVWNIAKLDNGLILKSHPIHFGDKRYQHYYDKFGYYKQLNHLDRKRRKLYRERHKNDYIKNPNYPGFWSYNFLW